MGGRAADVSPPCRKPLWHGGLTSAARQGWPCSSDEALILSSDGSGLGSPVGVDQFLDRLTQQRLAAETHAERANLVGGNLVFRTAVEVGDLAPASRHLLGEAGHLLF